MGENKRPVVVGAQGEQGGEEGRDREARKAPRSVCGRPAPLFSFGFSFSHRLLQFPLRSARSVGHERSRGLAVGSACTVLLREASVGPAFPSPGLHLQSPQKVWSFTHATPQMQGSPFCAAHCGWQVSAGLTSTKLCQISAYAAPADTGLPLEMHGPNASQKLQNWALQFLYHSMSCGPFCVAPVQQDKLTCLRPRMAESEF